MGDEMLSGRLEYKEVDDCRYDYDWETFALLLAITTKKAVKSGADLARGVDIRDLSGSRTYIRTHRLRFQNAHGLDIDFYFAIDCESVESPPAPQAIKLKPTAKPSVIREHLQRYPLDGKDIPEHNDDDPF